MGGAGGEEVDLIHVRWSYTEAIWQHQQQSAFTFVWQQFEYSTRLYRLTIVTLTVSLTSCRVRIEIYAVILTN